MLDTPTLPSLVGVLTASTTPTPVPPPPTEVPTEVPVVAPPEAPVERVPAAQPAPTPAPEPAPPPPPPPAGSFRYDIASGLASAFNDVRSQNGLGGVSVNGSLNAAAESYVEYHYLNYGPYALSHTYDGAPADRAARQGYGCCLIGEVIAYGANSAQGFLDMWMNSSGHRDIILDGRYTDVGIGCYQSGSESVLCVATFGATSW